MFQFYNSPIKSAVSGMHEGLINMFQFYNSPIKSFDLDFLYRTSKKVSILQ